MFNSYSYEILYEQFHWIYLQGDIKLLPVTINNGLKFEIEIVHDLSCHPIVVVVEAAFSWSTYNLLYPLNTQQIAWLWIIVSHIRNGP